MRMTVSAGGGGCAGRAYALGVMGEDGRGWSFAAARQAARFALAMEIRGPAVEHAFDDAGTLCGIDERRVDIFRTLFSPGAEQAGAEQAGAEQAGAEQAGAEQVCSACRRLAAEAPTIPSAQERLHELVSGAARGYLRDELLEALRLGADVRLWINRPGADLAKSYAGLDRLVDGRDTVAAALDGGARAGVALVRHDLWEFVVALPEGGRPTVGRGIADEG
ncbi:hypothetical protein [Actinoplanes sp. NPDC026670]|uniref:hypothetical protein n=1 Tax=Actinoplanes sp. NPDC026670 TaxID=3154700 RepID=UPI00340EF8A1